MDFLQLLPIINVLGFVVMAGATYYNSKRSGEGPVRIEVMELLDKQIAALKDEILRLREGNHARDQNIQSLTLEIGRMKGLMTSKDQQLEEFTKIFQNRDPEMLTVLNEIKDFMKLLHDKVNSNQARNEKIDKSTAKNAGHIMRKE